MQMWCVGVLVWWGSVCADVGVGGFAAGASGVGWALGMSCWTSSGVPGAIVTGMFGQVVAKQRGCHESPWLWVLRTRHSQPTKSALQTPHVAHLRGRRRGRIVWYSRVGRTMVRRLRFLVAVVAAAGGRDNCGVVVLVWVRRVW